jgi:hypothetical protein
MYLDKPIWILVDNILVDIFMISKFHLKMAMNVLSVMRRS